MRTSGESTPLASGFSQRNNSLSTRTKRFAAAGLCLLALAVSGSLLLSRSTDSPHAAVRREPVPQAATAAASFPGAADEIVDEVAKPAGYDARLYSGYLPLRNGGQGEQPRINLKKFVVGNGVNEFSGLSIVLYAYYHGFVSTAEYQLVRARCPHLREFEPSPSFYNQAAAARDPECADATRSVVAKLFLSHVNTYNVYSSCAGTTEDGVRALLAALAAPQSGLSHPIGNPLTMCLNSTQLDVFFNLPDVRAAMHAKPEIDRWYGDALTTSSLQVSGALLGIAPSAYEHTHLLSYSATLEQQVTPLWRLLLAAGVQGVIYHGDADMVCDFIGGLWAVESLQLPRKGVRAPWTVELDGAQQTGGFVEAFEGLTYVTVKGAGHLVPIAANE
ncbi:hypothetical protein PybrP1_005911 [[Pythium] brassicae (nom. inval.)]|nr:hypothetical protein PybrP1_005911 [[Pythium] brassicae (nom. inval.)]